MSTGINSEDLQEIKNAGLVDLESEQKATFILKDNNDVSLQGNSVTGVHFLPLHAGLKKFPQMQEKLWTLVDKNSVAQNIDQSEELNGYFIYVEAGAKAVLPLQACFLIRADRTVQKVHNLIVLEQDAQLHVINGCMSAHLAHDSRHYGITETFIGKNSTLSYTMIHDWNEQTQVFPKSATYVGENATFLSNYIAFKSAKLVKTNPLARIQKGAVARFNTVVYAPQDSFYDLGSRSFLEGEGARTEIISRAVSDGGTVITPAHIKSLAAHTKGHMECSALLLRETGRIHAVPELESYDREVELSHEAAIGRISDEALNYLMSRGLDQEEATATIVRGFLDLEIKGLPEQINRRIRETVGLLNKKSL